MVGLCAVAAIAIAGCESDGGRRPTGLRAPDCYDDVDCLDTVECTRDVCNSGYCVHEGRPTECGIGEVCNSRRDCTTPQRCEHDEDCEDGDACTEMHACIAGRCFSRRVDADSDGDPPLECGGSDCDDAAFGRRGGFDFFEQCDGVDDDCDSVVDEGPSICGEGECVGGRCVCAAGAMECSGQCWDRDGGGLAGLCGSCDAPCYTSCTGGVCDCGPGQSWCADGCRTGVPAEGGCGACGVPCGAGEECSPDGRCVCAPGRVECGLAGCVDPRTALEHCGACGVGCSACEECVEGACVPLDRDQLVCGELRACVAGDREAHCGACSTHCAAGEACTDGACACDEGTTRCGDACVYTASDARHCGGCDRPCERGSLCVDGACAEGCVETTWGQVCGAAHRRLLATLVLDDDPQTIVMDVRAMGDEACALVTDPRGVTRSLCVEPTRYGRADGVAGPAGVAGLGLALCIEPEVRTVAIAGQRWRGSEDTTGVTLAPGTTSAHPGSWLACASSGLLVAGRVESEMPGGPFAVVAGIAPRGPFFSAFWLGLPLAGASAGAIALDRGEVAVGGWQRSEDDTWQGWISASVGRYGTSRGFAGEGDVRVVALADGPGVVALIDAEQGLEGALSGLLETGGLVVVRLGPELELLWATALPGVRATPERAWSATQAAPPGPELLLPPRAGLARVGERVVIAASAEGPVTIGEQMVAGHGGRDIVVVELEGREGAITSADAFGGPGDDEATGLAIGSDGTLWVSGHSSGGPVLFHLAAP